MVPRVREAVAAGRFYPGRAARLRSVLEGLLAARAPAEAPPRAIIVPHAGYEYSGPIAAAAFALLAGAPLRRVVILAPSHFEPFRFASLYPGEAYQTPLGDVPLDQAASEALAGSSSRLQLSARGHWPAPEHSLEVELPFLQFLGGGFELVPVLFGTIDEQVSLAAGEALARLASPGTLLVASTDLSHFHSRAEAGALDSCAVEAMEEGDPSKFLRIIASGKAEACGAAPVAALLAAARHLNWGRFRVVARGDSGDAGRDLSSVVGYAALAAA